MCLSTSASRRSSAARSCAEYAVTNSLLTCHTTIVHSFVKRSHAKSLCTLTQQPHLQGLALFFFDDLCHPRRFLLQRGGCCCL